MLGFFKLSVSWHKKLQKIFLTNRILVSNELPGTNVWYVFLVFSSYCHWWLLLLQKIPNLNPTFSSYNSFCFSCDVLVWFPKWKKPMNFVIFSQLLYHLCSLGFIILKFWHYLLFYPCNGIFFDLLKNIKKKWLIASVFTPNWSF